MKKALALILAAAFVLGFAACAAKSSDPILGTYKGTYFKLVGEDEKTEDEFSVELRKDGKGVSRRAGEEFDMTWTLEGDKFTMTETFLEMKIEYTGTLANGKLDIFAGDPASDYTTEYHYQKVEKPE